MTQDDVIATVTWYRPQVANAFDAALAHELADVVLDISADNSTEICVLQGSGRHFSSGWDLDDLRTLEDPPTPDDLYQYFAAGTALLDALTDMRPLVVTRHRGVTAGFGVALAARSDLVVADPESRFGCPEVAAGLVPRLVAAELVGVLDKNDALTWLATGRLFSADEAATAGLVTLVLDDEAFADLLARWTELARETPGCLAETKATANELGLLAQDERRGRAIDLTVKAMASRRRT